MYLDCPRCQTKYLLDRPEKADPQKTFKCTTCGEIFSATRVQDDCPTQVSQKKAIHQLPSNKKIYLKILTGPKAGVTYQILKPIVSIGRGSQADIEITDPAISRKHCAIEVSSNKTVLRDLNSKNGTMVTGEEINFITMPDQTEFEIGDSRICYIEIPVEG